MARVSSPKVDSAGVYAHLGRYYEDDRREWVENVGRSHAADDPYPRQRILDGLRAGSTVNVPSSSLPASVLAGAPSRLGAPIRFGPARGSLARIVPERAVVTPDDSITFTDDGWAAKWLAENDL